MTRFLIFALAGALSLAGGTGLAFGENAGPKTPTKPQAKKPAPPPPKKQPPSKPATQATKPPSHRDVKVDVPKGGPQPTANKTPAKPGNGSKPGAGSYSLDDLNRDLKKANQEQWDGFKEELPVDAAMVATAASGRPRGRRRSRHCCGWPAICPWKIPSAEGSVGRTGRYRKVHRVVVQQQLAVELCPGEIRDEVAHVSVAAL